MGKIRDQLKKIIFGTETFGGRLFDLLLIVAIISSVLIVMLDSVSEYHNFYGNIFLKAEWVFTILFTIEYAAEKAGLTAFNSIAAALLIYLTGVSGSIFFKSRITLSFRNS